MIIDQQAGFRPGKSTTGQLLNLTQHIEDGYERGVVTGTVFVDLSAAYDTISHKLQLNKMYRMTSDIKFTDLIGNMLSNRRYFNIISGMNNTTCSSDPFPTRLLMSHLYAIVPILQHIINLCLTTGDFPISCKSSIVIPLIKKPGLDREMLKNYRLVSNLSFLSIVIEKVISIRILGHILDNNIVDSFQSAYRAGHSCETDLLRVYNDIVTTVGKGNG